MGKKLVVLAVVIVLIVVGVFILALVNANSLIATFKPDLERMASQSLGAPVTLGQLSVNVFPQAKIRATEFKLASSVPGQEPGISLKELALDIRLLPLLQKKLQITRLSIGSPTITLVKTPDGITVQGLNLTKKTSSENAPALDKSPHQPHAATENKSSLDFSLDAVSLSNGRIVLKDQNKDYSFSGVTLDSAVAIQGSDVQVSDLKVRLKALEQTDLEIHAPRVIYQANKVDIPELSVTGLGSSLKISCAYNIFDKTGQVRVSSDNVDLGSLTPALPAVVKEMKLQGVLKPDLKASLGPRDSYHAGGVVNLAGVGLVKNQFTVSGIAGPLTLDATPESRLIKTQNLAFTLNGQSGKLGLAATMKGQALAVSEIMLQLFGGTLSGDFNLALNADKTFSTNLKASGIRVEDALEVSSPGKPAALTGTLQTMTLKASGLSVQMPQSLSGSGYLDLRDASLKGINLAGTVLKAVNNIPFLAGALYDAVPPSQRSSVESNDTPIKSLTANLTFAAGALRTPDLKAVSSIFSLEADGKVGFDSNLDLNATIIFDQTFSAHLVSNTKELKNLLDQEGRLIIPLTLQGVPPKLLVYPNLKKLLEVGATRTLRNKAEELLGGALQKGKGKGLGGLLGGF